MQQLWSEHEADVERICKNMKRFHAAGTRVKIWHGSTNSTRKQSFDKERMIDTSSLTRILEINEKEEYALVEPNVPMDQLVRETMKRGLIPPVVMEFPGITVGGGIQGGAGESSSYKEGLFHEICLSYEMVLGNGELMTVSREEHPDLFWGTACSYGTLGVITLAKVKLVPATKYVQLTYTRVRSLQESIERVRAVSHERRADFIDGVLFANDRGAIITGMRTDEREGSIARFTGAFDDWFYLHAERIARAHDTYTETVPLYDYLFRYDRGGFWVGWYGFKRWNIPFNRLTRFLFDPFLKTRELYDILHATNTSQQFFVQDINFPEETALDFLELTDRETGIYPLWLCPLPPDPRTSFSPAHIESALTIDIGIWGELPSGKRDYETLLALNRRMEQETRKRGGRKILYAHAYYPEDEFWEEYDKPSYEALREKYHASRAFPDIYEKVRVTDKYQAKIKDGLLALIARKLPQTFGFRSRSRC